MSDLPPTNYGHYGYQGVPFQQPSYPPPGGYHPPTGGGYTPSPINISVQDNPQLKALYGDMSQLAGDMANKHDAYSTGALGRERALQSGTDAALMQGGLGNNSGMSTALRQRGQIAANQNIGKLNAELSNQGQQNRMGMLGLQSNLALGTASNQLGQQNFGLDVWRAQNQAAQSASNMYNQMQQQNFQNQLQMMQNGGYLSGYGGAAGGYGNRGAFQGGLAGPNAASYLPGGGTSGPYGNGSYGLNTDPLGA